MRDACNVRPGLSPFLTRATPLIPAPRTGGEACIPLFEMLHAKMPSMVRAAARSDDAAELAVAAAQGLTDLIDLSPPLAPFIYEDLILPTALAALDSAPLVSSEESRVGSEWLHFILLLLRTGQLPPPTLERLVLPWALRKGEVSAPVCHRLLCTHVLGAIAEGCFLATVGDAAPRPSPAAAAHSWADAPSWIELHFLAPALSMCQDTELAVRCSMCEQLRWIARTVGPECSSGAPLSELLELASDEHPEVRAAAFGCSVAMMSACDDARRVELLEPAIRRAVHAADDASRSDDQLLRWRVAENLSALFDALGGCGYFGSPQAAEHASGAGVSVYEAFLVGLATADDVELRTHCVRALPAAAAALVAQGEHPISPISRLMANCVQALREDGQPEVCVALSESLPAMATALGPSLAASHVWPQMMWVLGRGQPESSSPLLQRLHKIIEAVSSPCDPSSSSSPSSPSSSALHPPPGVQLLPVVLALDAPLSSARSYRHAVAFISACGDLTEHIDPQALFTSTLPALFGQLSPQVAAPCRREAIRVICLQLRKLRTQAQRSEICARLVADLCESASHVLRLCFVHACALLLDPSPPCGCSRAFFKEHALHTALLSLSADPVANVRLAFCEQLAPLKRTMRLPTDADALQMLQHAAVTLQSDGARDVQRAASVADRSLRQLDVLTEGAPLRRTPSGGERWWEDEDAARLAEEEALHSAEQEAYAEAKRRAAEELAERARAAYAQKFAVETGRRGGGVGGDGVRSRNVSRELDAMPRASGVTNGHSTAAMPWASGRASNPYPTLPSAVGMGTQTSAAASRLPGGAARRSSRDAFVAAIAGGGAGRGRRQSGDALSSSSSSAVGGRGRRQSSG